MPLFQPSNITPSSFAGVGNGTVAQADPIQITWQVNGNVPMTGFKIEIFDENGKSVGGVGLTTPEPTPTPFYPTDNKGNPNFYTYSSSNTWDIWDVQDGNAYTMQITQYWSTDGQSNNNSIAQISQSSFIARTRPTLSLLANGQALEGATVETVALNVVADYSQAQGDGVEWVRWRFYQTDENGNDIALLDDTGVVNTQVFNYALDNMQSGNSYTVVCTAQTTNGVEVTATAKFSVSYELPKIEGQFNVDCSDKMSNLLSCKNVYTTVGDDIQGTANGVYSFSNGQLSIPNGSEIIWDQINGETPLNIPTNMTNGWTLGCRGGSIGLKNNTTNKEVITTNPVFNSVDFSHIPKYTYALSIYDDENEVVWGVIEGQRNMIVCSSYSDGLLSSFVFSSTEDEIPYIDDISINYERNILVAVGKRLRTAQDGASRSVQVFSISDFQLTAEDGNSYVDELNTVSFANGVNMFAAGNDNFILLYSINANYGLRVNSHQRTTIGAGHYCFNPSNTFLISSYTLTDQYNTNMEVFAYPLTLTNAYVLGRGVQTSISITGQYSASIAPYIFLGEDTIALWNRIYRVSKGGFTLIKIYYDSVVCPVTVDKSRQVIIVCNAESNRTSTTFRAIRLATGSSASPSTTLGCKNVERTTLGNFVGWDDSASWQYNRLGVIVYRWSFVGTLEGKTIYDATITSVDSSVMNPTISYQGSEYKINGIDVNAFQASVSLSYIEESAPLQETYLEIGDWLTVSRDADVIQFQIDGTSELQVYTIPQNISNLLFFVNQSSILVYFEGSATPATPTNTINLTNYPQTKIEFVRLIGQQNTDWLFIEEGQKSFDNTLTPVWGTDTVFLTHFEIGSLRAGLTEKTKPRLDIYRKNIATGTIQKIYSSPVDITQLRDFSWITGKLYEYTAFALLAQKITAQQSFIPSPICKRQNFYLLLETVQDEEQLNVYHVINSWRFGANISAGSVSNNNSPNFLSNFTPYRLKQPSTRNSKSGTLQALISNVQNGKYADTVEQMERLYDISNSLNTFFLKDMKGNLYMVSIANAITQTINTKSSVQEVTVSIPWEETGSADGVSIIQTPEDNGWVGSNQVANVRLATKIDGDNIAQELDLPDDVSIDFVDGQLYVTYPDGYQGTTFSLDENGNLIATTPEQQQQPKLYLANGTVKLETEN